MTRPQSRTDADLEARLETLPGEGPRKDALLAARRFKSSWVELGEALVAVRKAGQHKSWGYATFEAYCRQELHIKPDTMNKLTRSFAFLQEHAPKRLQSAREGAAVPALDVVDLLSQASARTKVSADALANIGADILEGEGAVSRNDLLKRLRQDDPEAFRKKPKTAPAATAVKEVDLRKALLLAERLSGLLGETGDVVSPETLGNLQNVVAELRAAYGRAQPEGRPEGGTNLVQDGQMH